LKPVPADQNLLAPSRWALKCLMSKKMMSLPGTLTNTCPLATETSPLVNPFAGLNGRVRAMMARTTPNMRLVSPKRKLPARKKAAGIAKYRETTIKKYLCLIRNLTEVHTSAVNGD